MVDIFVNRGLTSTTWNDSSVRHPSDKTHVPLGFDVVHVDLTLCARISIRRQLSGLLPRRPRCRVCFQAFSFPTNICNICYVTRIRFHSDGSAPVFITTSFEPLHGTGLSPWLCISAKIGARLQSLVDHKL